MCVLALIGRGLGGAFGRAGVWGRCVEQQVVVVLLVCCRDMVSISSVVSCFVVCF